MSSKLPVAGAQKTFFSLLDLALYGDWMTGIAPIKEQE